MPIHIALFLRVVTRKPNELYFKLLIIYPKQTMVFFSLTHTQLTPSQKQRQCASMLGWLNSEVDLMASKLLALGFFNIHTPYSHSSIALEFMVDMNLTHSNITYDAGLILYLFLGCSSSFVLYHE